MCYSLNSICLTDPLSQRQHDPDENVRMDVVQAIVGAARIDFTNVNDDLLNCVKERTLDKKVRRCYVDIFPVIVNLKSI